MPNNEEIAAETAPAGDPGAQDAPKKAATKKGIGAKKRAPKAERAAKEAKPPKEKKPKAPKSPKPARNHSVLGVPASGRAPGVP